MQTVHVSSPLQITLMPKTVNHKRKSIQSVLDSVMSPCNESYRRAKLLKLPKSMPVLVTESVEVDPTTTPVKYGVARFAGDRVNLFIES